MNPEIALRWLGITPWVPRSGVPPLMPAQGAMARAAAAEPAPAVILLPPTEPDIVQPDAAQAQTEQAEIVQPKAEPTEMVQPVTVSDKTTPPTLWLINLAPDQPLVAAILRALPSSVGWQVRAEADAPPSLQWGEQCWSLSALQADGRARRAVWRHLYPQSAH